MTGGPGGLGVGFTPMGEGADVTGPWPATIGTSAGGEVNSVTGETVSGLEVVRDVHFLCGSPVVP